MLNANVISIGTTAFLLALAPSMAFAELKSEMAAYVVTADANGNERHAVAGSVKPGQTIEYRLTHTNTFDNAISGVAVIGPVPEGSELIVGTTKSDAPSRFEVRGDFDPDNPGEEWSALPAMRIVVNDDGTRTVEQASPEHFTAVRWQVQGAMQSHASVRHAYRVQVK